MRNTQGFPPDPSLPPLIKFRVGDFCFSRDRDFRKIRGAFWVRGGDQNFSRHVRTKTFSAHLTPEIRHVVSRTGVSAHVTTSAARNGLTK